MKKSWDRTGIDFGQVSESKFAEQDGVCAYCLHYLDNEKVALSHIIPRRLGGTSEPSNLRLVCSKCSKTKQVSVRLPEILWTDFEKWKEANQSNMPFSEVVRMALHEFLPTRNIRLEGRDEIETLVRTNSELEKRLDEMKSQARDANMKLYKIWIDLGGQPL